MKKVITILITPCLVFFLLAGCTTERELRDARHDGYEEGYEDGESHGYNSGFDAGVEAGYEDGYDDGYIDGFAEGADSNEVFTQGLEAGISLYESFKEDVNNHIAAADFINPLTNEPITSYEEFAEYIDGYVASRNP